MLSTFLEMLLEEWSFQLQINSKQMHNIFLNNVKDAEDNADDTEFFAI